ncbi:MAG: hypothetical protein EPO13_12450 [Actinomycetota bacterium]|nr:MAG: hypothetical protein EPO13_12450 [Actinomycetota bacterium]
MRCDVHAHLCPADVPDFADRFSDAAWPVVTHSDTGSAIERAGAVYRRVDARYWGLPERLRFLDEVAVDVQVVSPLPVLLPYWAPPAEATVVSRWLNEATAAYVARQSDRLIGFGTVAAHDGAGVEAALDQIVELGLAGVEIGSTYGGLELGAPELRPFFHAAAARDLPVLLHPLEGAGLGRLTETATRFSVGVLTDTALAATSLALSGALDDVPDLRLCLSHGGGGFFWTLPRLRGIVDAERAARLARLQARVWVDSASVSVEQLGYLGGLVPSGKILLGSDFPATGNGDPMAALAAVGEPDEATLQRATHEFLRR